MPDEQPQDPPGARPPTPERGAPVQRPHHPELPSFRFLEELKRRNVGRVAILYTVVSYVALQVLELFLHLLELPAWTGRVAVLVTVVGFPAALVFAWVYEITPEGLKLTEEVAPQHSIRRHTGKRLDRAIIAVLAIALSYFVVDKFWLSKHSAQATARTTTEVKATPVKATPAAAVAPDKSVAVLPFLDMSEKHDQEYFSDGLSEELIDMLTKVPDLRVPARTSSFYFKGKQTTIKDIATALGVAHVLEGSVRKSGKTLRITAQLIRVDNGYHLWSETFDRKLDDIFKVQDEIAGAVVKALRVSLGTDAAPHTRSASSTDMYTLLLQARFLYVRGTPNDVKKSLDYYQQAVRLDSNSAPAWSGLSRALGQLPYLGLASCQQVRKQAIDAAERARSLDPGLADAHVVLGRIHFRCDWNWAAAEADFKKAIALDARDSNAVSWAAIVAFTLGHLSESIQLFRRAQALDPLDWTADQGLMNDYFAMGRFAEAEVAAQRLVELTPTAPYVHASLGQVLVARGAAEEGLAEIERETDQASRSSTLAWAYQVLGRKAEADAALARLEATQAASGAYTIASLYALRGNVDRAFAWLERAYWQRDASLAGVKTDPDLKNVRSDPRYKAFLRKMGLPE
jgi:adenylate cyclase